MISYSLECRLRRANGVYRWWLIRGVPVLDKLGNILKWVGTCTDIDDIKQAESQVRIAAERERAAEALRESVRREIERAAELAAILDAAPVAIFIAHDPDCLHITGNSAADALLRNPLGGEASLGAPVESKPNHFRAFKDGRELSIDELPAQQAARGFQVQNFEFSLVFDDGITRNVVANGTPLRDEQGRLRGAVLVMVDITERKLAEMALKESEERHRVLADTMLQGVVHQNANGKVISMNPAAERILGKSSKEFLGETSVDVEHHTIHEDGSPFPGSEHPAMIALQTGQSVRGVVMGVFNPREQVYRWISIDAVPVFRLGDDHPSEAYAVFADITERKKADEELHRAHVELELRVKERTAELAQTLATLQKESADRLKAVQELHEKDKLLLQQSRLAAMGEIVNNIAHQWRQPLNVLGINIQSLSLFYDMGDFSKEFLDETTKNAMIQINHMSQTIDDFRNFFKPDKEKTDFSVNKAIQQAITLIEEIFKYDHVDIVTQIHCEELINGYPNEFSQVILNILQNAHDAFVERKVKEGRITITTSNENDRVVVTIADNGGGIPDEIIGQIFEPYFSTKGLQGTGIGLYMSKSIIEKNMGGSLTVRNTAEGAEFRIEV